MMVSRFLTAEQAADLLQTDTGTLRRLAREGRIPATKIGRQWRFDEGLLREWVRERSLNSLVSTEGSRARGSAAKGRR